MNRELQHLWDLASTPVAHRDEEGLWRLQEAGILVRTTKWEPHLVIDRLNNRFVIRTDFETLTYAMIDWDSVRGEALGVLIAKTTVERTVIEHKLSAI